MDETALSLEVDRDFLPDWSRMLPLPEHPDCDEADRHLARGARLRLWRSGVELRPAVEAEIAEAVEHGEVAADDAEACIDRVCLILAGDGSIADPPRRGTVEGVLEDSRMKLCRLLRPLSASQGMDTEPCPFDVDQYGNFPGMNWRKVLDWGLSRVCRWPHTNVPLSTSHKIAWKILRDEVTRDAAAVAAREEAERSERRDLAVASLPAVFEGEQQEFFSLVRRFNAGGDIKVPTDGNPITEAALLRQVRNLDFYGLSPAQQSDVAAELIRVVAAAESQAEGPLIVPEIGYAIVVERANIVDVLPGNLTLTIEGREHVLNSPELPRPVRMPAKVFRSARLSAEAIYEQALVEVDIPRGHWRKWWPVLAARLVKLARRVEVGQRVEAWKQFVAGVVATAPDSPHSLPGGAPYRSTRDGKCYFGKQWLIEQALAAGVIGSDGEKAFSDWLGTADRNRRDAEGRQHWMIAITGNSPLCIGAACEPASKSDAACSKDANEP
jgi:hypothetical protein